MNKAPDDPNLPETPPLHHPTFKKNHIAAPGVWASLLYAGTIVADIHSLSWLNRCARQIYFALLPSLTSHLRRSVRRKNVKIITRNSITESSSFNLFASDIDIAAILDEEPTVAETRALLHAYNQLKEKLPPLGELEIYTQEEWALRERIMRGSGEWVDLIWNLRKWVWQYQARNQAKTRYHRYKAERSIRRIQAKIGTTLSVINPEEADLREVIAHRLIGPLSSGPLTAGRSEHLQWSFREMPLGFACILPDAEFFLCEFREKILELRKEPLLGSLTASLATWERLLCVNRGRLFMTQYDPKWQEHLLKLEREYGEK